MIRGYAISGRAGSGKSTLCQHLIEELNAVGVPAVRVSFGDALKHEVAAVFGVTKDDPGGREILVRYGEEKRNADPLYWVTPFAERAREEIQEGNVAVCDDLRFLSELGWCHAYGFELIRLEVPVHVCASRIAQPPDPNSPGECELMPWRRWDRLYSDATGDLDLSGVAQAIASSVVDVRTAA